MRTLAQLLTGAEKILCALAEFDYLTAEQLTRLLYAPSSLRFVRKKLQALVASGLVLALPSRAITLPYIYTPTSKGYTYLARLGMQQAKRVRPVKEREKAQNLFFREHTMAVTDVLIGAKLLAQTTPGIVLNRLYLERELKRKIYVELPTNFARDQTRQICLEPDASCDFTIQGKWQDFFHLEVYRTHLREYRFKQKIHGYLVYAASPLHQQLFHTPALAIAVFCATEQLAATLQRWTEEVLHERKQPELGERFFFRSLMDPATASPAEMYLTPVWKQAFGEAPTPLLLLATEEK
jgi:hypothetical protein